MRIEKDSMGEIEVASDAYWGAQTQRSLNNFKIGTELMPYEVIQALVYIKKACAVVNYNHEIINKKVYQGIMKGCSEILEYPKKWRKHFPLKVWQTGSGTQTNMNVNEVIANIAKEQGYDIHPNDHVNRSQSSNDVFPSAMHIATVVMIANNLIPELIEWEKELEKQVNQYQDIIKIGRTHLQDATPLTFGQEVSGWKSMIRRNREAITSTSHFVEKLAIGGTAVGTGINAPLHFGEEVANYLSKELKQTLESDDNKFFALTSHQPLSLLHGALRSLASDILKIVNDIRFLASGPRCGLGELTLPSNEPGSSIMPGKVNPTQAEALSMVVMQVMGNDTTIQFAASQGQFQLNVYKPVIIMNILQSIELLSSGMRSFRLNTLQGLKVNERTMTEYIERSLMLVTALTPHIGYDKASHIAHDALENDITIFKACEKHLVDVPTETISSWLNPFNMI